MKNYKQQLDTLFSRAQQASAGTRLLSEGDIRNLLAEGTPAPVTTSTKPKGIRQMIIATSATGLAALITMGTLFFAHTPQPQQAAKPAAVRQQTVPSGQSRHYSTPGIASKEIVGKEKAQVVKPALEAPVSAKQATQEERATTIDLQGVRMLELTDAELNGLGVEHKNDAVTVYQRRSNGRIHALSIGSFGTSFDASVEPAPPFPVLSEEYLRMITDDLGNRRIEQYNNDKEAISENAAKEAGLTTMFIPNHSALEQSTVIEIRGSGNNKTQTTRLATAQEISDFTNGQSSRKEIAQRTMSDIRTEKWIAIAVKSDKPQSSDGKQWRTNYVLWYEPTPEVVAALPERYRSEIERELQTATGVADGSTASGPGTGFTGMWQTKSGAVTASSVYPNPAENGAVTLGYTLSSPRSVQVTLRSITGALLSRLGTKQQQAGTWTEEYKVGNLRPGMYLISIETNNGEYSTQRFIVK